MASVKQILTEIYWICKPSNNCKLFDFWVEFNKLKDKLNYKIIPQQNIVYEIERRNVMLGDVFWFGYPSITSKSFNYKELYVQLFYKKGGRDYVYRTMPFYLLFR